MTPRTTEQAAALKRARTQATQRVSPAWFVMGVAIGMILEWLAR